MGLLNKAFAVLGHGDVHSRSGSFSSIFLNFRHSLFERTFQRVVSFAERSCCCHNFAAFSRKFPCDLSANAPAGAGDYAYFPIQFTHDFSSLIFENESGFII